MWNQAVPVFIWVVALCLMCFPPQQCVKWKFNSDCLFNILFSQANISTWCSSCGSGSGSLGWDDVISADVFPCQYAQCGFFFFLARFKPAWKVAWNTLHAIIYLASGPAKLFSQLHFLWAVNGSGQTHCPAWAALRHLQIPSLHLCVITSPPLVYCMIAPVSVTSLSLVV